MAKKKPKTRSSRNKAENTPPPLSESQLEIMQLVWGHGEVTATDVWCELKPQRDVARNTVLTVMDRLVKRGWLQKRRIGNTQLYQASVDQEDSNGAVVSRMVDTVFSGAADQLVAALLNGRGLTDEEADRIKKMIDAKRKADKER